MDLISSLLSAGRQIEPAIVREVSGENGVCYEVLSGVRRLWCIRWLREHGYSDFKFYVRVEDFPDKEAFEYAIFSNQQGHSFSDYELGHAYKAVIDRELYKSQTELAGAIGAARSSVSKSIVLGQLPIQIVHAFAELHDCKMKYGAPLRRLLKQRDTAIKLMDESIRVMVDQRAHRADDLPPIPGSEVYARITRGTPEEKSGGSSISFGNPDLPTLTVERQTRSKLVFSVPVGVDVDEACGALSDYLAGHKRQS